MTLRTTGSARAQTIRDLAVHAVMARGTLEKSGAARLAVLNDQGLMIGYRTPFNPLPPLSHAVRYEAAGKDEIHWNDPYAIDVWLEDFGKVFSASWDHHGDLRVRLCRPGAWQCTLAAIAAAETANTDRQPNAEEEAMSRKKPQKTREGQSSRHRAAAHTDLVQRDRLRTLEQENKNLRRAISGLMIDKLILAKAAAGKL